MKLTEREIEFLTKEYQVKGVFESYRAKGRKGVTQAIVSECGRDYLCACLQEHINELEDESDGDTGAIEELNCLLGKIERANVEWRHDFEHIIY